MGRIQVAFNRMDSGTLLPTNKVATKSAARTPGHDQLGDCLGGFLLLTAMPGAMFVASLLLVAMPFAPSSFL